MSPEAPLRSTPAGVLAWCVVVFGFPALTLTGLVVLWRAPTTSEIAVASLSYAVAGLGISLGWHRFFAHRGFTTGSSFKVLLALAGSLAFEGSLSSWVANHRAHHAHTDRPGDPHSPWTENGLLRGLVHAHFGWLRLPGTSPHRLARDILADRRLSFVSDWWWVWALSAVLLPATLAASFTGVDGFVGMVVWAGLLRIVVFHHVTWSVNSVCHVLGTRQFETSDRSGNVWWLAVPSFGESWHNNHHHDPRAARHGMVRGQLDLTAELLRVLERCRVVSAPKWPHRQDRSD